MLTETKYCADLIFCYPRSRESPRKRGCSRLPLTTSIKTKTHLTIKEICFLSWWLLFPILRAVDRLHEHFFDFTDSYLSSRCDITWNFIAVEMTHMYRYKKSQTVPSENVFVTSSETSCGLICYLCKCDIHRTSIHVQLLLANCSTYQNNCVKIKTCLEC